MIAEKLQHRNNPIFRFGILLTTIFFMLGSQTACTSTRLPPYEATYATKVSGIKIKGVRKFQQTDTDTYKLSWKARVLWMKLDEWSEFTIVDDKVRPLSYHYTRKGLGSDRPVHIYFNWDTMQATGKKGNKEYQFAINENTLDKLSYQIQMQIDLIENKDKKAFSFDVANYNGLRNYQFDYKGTETIECELGDQQTLVFERNTASKNIKLWISSQQNYLPVRIDQIDDKDHYTAKITRWDSEVIEEPRFTTSNMRLNNAQNIVESDNLEQDF